MRHNRNGQGFTLIELIIVIVLLGILAATALPKFADLSTQARQAANRGIAGSLAAAVNIAHAQWVAAGTSPASITFSGNAISMNSTAADAGYGFPCLAGAGGCSSATVADAAACTALFPLLIQSGPEIQAAAGSCTSPGCYVASGATSICTYTRNDTTGISIAYDYKLATVTPTPQ